MLRATLTRFDQGGQGTFGRFDLPGLSLYTGEQPWRDNATGVSCIPVGVYQAIWTRSPRFRRHTYLLLGTAPRTGIRIHAANLMGDTVLEYKSQLLGCIALGERLGYLDGQKALLLSAPAVGRFERALAGRPFELEIRNA